MNFHTHPRGGDLRRSAQMGGYDPIVGSGVFSLRSGWGGVRRGRGPVARPEQLGCEAGSSKFPAGNYA